MPACAGVAMAQQTLKTFGSVHLLFNNAGVAAGSSVWESSLLDWQWVMGVNLWGVIHGIRVFVPILIAQDTPCHIVNTASMAGLVTRGVGASYHATKHAVVALSERLCYSLAERKAQIGVFVLCPGWVRLARRGPEADGGHPATTESRGMRRSATERSHTPGACERLTL
jgi:NAD(P)-dependent dehydrogenase (short-subunit alcohol dehydrogenase family)